MLAPILPYVTEEVWSWWQEGSIHRAAWPVPDVDLPGTSEDPGVLDATASALAGIRGAKSTAKVSMRTKVTRATVTGPAAQLQLVERALDDLASAGQVTGELVLAADDVDELSVEAELVTAN
jgi:valyl-tRNA synthetase